MLIIKIIFWISLLIVFYSYLGYGIILWIYLKIRQVVKGNAQTFPQQKTAFEPAVTLLVAAYNEADILEQKIRNCFALDYPDQKLEIIFITDGSDDNGPEIVQKYPRIKLLHKPERRGKLAAINRAMTHVTSPFVIFCDANTSLNPACIKEIIKHYQDEQIGAVAGEKKINNTSVDGGSASAGEGLYWKYESFLKKLDSSFYTVVGAAGELFSIRTALFETVESNILLDDFMISMNICKKGYRVLYEPKAFASEAPSLSMKEEQKRKIRISAGGFQSVVLLKELLNVFKYGKLTFQYFSHRVLRWIVCPVLLPIILLLNITIFANEPGNHLYALLLFGQFLFYFAATIGWLFAAKNIKVKLLYIPYYFVFMNIALYIGFSRFNANKQTVLWDKAKRKIA